MGSTKSGAKNKRTKKHVLKIFAVRAFIKEVKAEKKIIRDKERRLNSKRTALRNALLDCVSVSETMRNMLRTYVVKDLLTLGRAQKNFNIDWLRRDGISIPELKKMLVELQTAWNGVVRVKIEKETDYFFVSFTAV